MMDIQKQEITDHPTPTTIAEIIDEQKRAFGVSPLAIKESADSDLTRFDIILFASPEAAQKCAKDYNLAFLGTSISVWVNHDHLMTRMRLDDPQGPITFNYTYNVPDIHDLYDLGVPHSAKVIDERLTQNLQTLMDRLDARAQKTFGNYTALLANYELDANNQPSPNHGFVFLYAVHDHQWLADQFRLFQKTKAGRKPRPRRRSPIPTRQLAFPRSPNPSPHPPERRSRRILDHVRQTRLARLLPQKRPSPMTPNAFQTIKRLLISRSKTSPPKSGLAVSTTISAPLASIPTFFRIKITLASSGFTTSVSKNSTTPTAAPLGGSIQNATTCPSNTLGPSPMPTENPLRPPAHYTQPLAPNGQWYPTDWREDTSDLNPRTGKYTDSADYYRLQILPTLQLDSSWFQEPHPKSFTPQPAP